MNKLNPVDQDISDQDILSAMSSIPGYLDISVEDFRSLFMLARRQAWSRMFAHIRAERLMKTGIPTLSAGTMLDQAARSMAEHNLKALPVTDDDRRVVGILTERDFLRRLQAPSFLSLMLDLMENPHSFAHRCHETPVSAAMSTPVSTVGLAADFHTISRAFSKCGGRSLPVVDEQDRLCGLLWRKDFIQACQPAADQ